MPKDLKIVAVGAGNIAHHLIPALHKLGCQITQVFSRTKTSARNLASRVNADFTNEISSVDKNADIYIIMISDDAISHLVDNLPELKTNPIVVHTSGATRSEVLKTVTQNFGVFYPLQSFRKNIKTDLKEVPFLICANNSETQRTLRVLARKLSASVHEINDEQRLHYHLSAVFINNFTNHLAYIADEILRGQNLNHEILKPISQTTFSKILDSNPKENQTGPAIRQDKMLQRKHLNLLKNFESWNEIYKSISKSIDITHNGNEDS